MKSVEYYLAKCFQQGECLIWPGATSGHGYPVANINGRGSFTYLHKWIYEQITNTVVSGGNRVDHICNIPRCLNPKHLQELTHGENLIRSRVGRPRKVDLSKAQELRNAGLNQSEIAKYLKVDQSAISRAFKAMEQVE